MRVSSVLWGISALIALIASLWYLASWIQALKKRDMLHFKHLMKMFLVLLVMGMAATMCVWTSL